MTPMTSPSFSSAQARLEAAANDALATSPGLRSVTILLDFQGADSGSKHLLVHRGEPDLGCTVAISTLALTAARKALLQLAEFRDQCIRDVQAITDGFKRKEEKGPADAQGGPEHPVRPPGPAV